MIALRYFLPRPDLRPYICSYYLFEADVPVVRDLLRAELPQMRFLLSGSGYYHYADGRSAHCPPAMLTGATNAPIQFDAQGPLIVMGIGILPAGWAALFGFDASEIADSTIDLGDLIGPAAVRTHLRLLEARNHAERVTVLDAFFSSLLATPRSLPLWFTRAADEWLVSTPNPQVDKLLDMTGVSARQLERLSNRIYGASPKLLARKYRALQAAVRIATGEAGSWADAAAEHYYDQSHFIRDFKQFTGMTPHRFATEQTPVTRLTITKRRLLPDMPRLLKLS